MFGSAESQVPRLIIRKLFSKNSNACDHSSPSQTDGKMDWTDVHGITVLHNTSHGKNHAKCCGAIWNFRLSIHEEIVTLGLFILILLKLSILF